jgi:PAS domain S-box-containing protein
MRSALARGDEKAAAGPTGGRTAIAHGLLTGRTGAWIFTLALAAAAVAVFVLLIIPLPAYDPGDELPWPVFAVAFGVAEIAVVHLRIRNRALTVSLSEIPLVIGFYFLAPAYLVVAQLVGAGVALVARRREGPLAIVYSLAIFGLGGSLGILVFRAVAPLAPPSLPAWWFASFLGAATVVTVSTLAVWAVVSIRRQRADREALRWGLAFGLAMAILDTSLALVAAVFLRTEPDELWLLVAPAAVGLLGYRAFSAQRLREARLEFLYECMQILQGPVLDEATLVRLLGRTHDMFRSVSVEAILVDASGDHAATRVVVDREGRSMVEAAGPDLVTGRRAMLGDPGEARLVARDLSKVGSARAHAETMIVPLRGSGGLRGTLMVAGRLDDVAAFGTDDLRILESLGSSLGLVAENSGLLERLAASLADVSQLAAIVKSSDDAILAVDLAGSITAWNPAAEELFGYSSETMLGHVPTEVLSDDERHLVRDGFADVLRGGAIHDIRVEGVHAGGGRIPVSITMSPIQGTDGQMTGVSAIIRDESERVRAEAVVAASTELLRAVIDKSPLGMGVAGADHRWIQANPALCALLGLTAEEAIGRSALEMIHPDDQETVQQLEERVFAGAVPARPVERRYVDRSGQVVTTEVTARLIREPSSDVPVAIYTIEDVTERRRDEEQARSTEERFRRAALSISAVQDPALVVRAVLESARDVLHAEYAAVATYAEDGSTMTSIEVDGLDSGEVLERVGRWPTGSGVLRMAPKPGESIRLRDVQADPAFVGFPNGHPRIVTFLALPIPHRGAGQTILFVANKVGADGFSEVDETIAAALATHAAVCLDNTRINARALELVRDLDRANLELVQANEAKSRFLASVAHELRTPLHAILIASELVHDPPAGPLTIDEVRTLGLTIESSGRHMVSLIDDLVDLSRIEAGRLEIRPAQVMLGDVLGEIASSLARAAETRGISLELPDGPGPAVFADPVRLRQILTNLVSNALKFTDRGGRIWIEVGSTHAATRITVHDTGTGIAPDDLERAFLPFEQVSRTSTPGAGLGLAISRSLAELHGGELTATSEPGVGSAFTVTLPSDPGASQRKPTSKPVALPVVAVGRGRPILVVEDDPTAMRLAADLLRMAGYQVWQARGLGEAVVLLDEANPDLVLLDVRLGDGSGLDLVERLRSDGIHHDLPILVMSADAMPDDVRRAREAGCDDFLAKPVSPRVLLARIHEMLGGAGETA